MSPIFPKYPSIWTKFLVEVASHKTNELVKFFVKRDAPEVYIVSLDAMPIKIFLQFALKCLVHLRNEHLLKYFKQAAIKADLPSVII